MAVITISRELGSAGSTIAERAARTLGYHFVDKRTIAEVLIQYGFVEFDKAYDSAPGFWARFDSRRAEMVDLLDRVIQALARHGDVVILGRGSFAVLAGFADVLNVRIQAPLPVRIERVLEQPEITDPDQAEAILQESDRVRAAFVESFYGVRWDTATAFDVVIGTGKVSPDLAVTWLVEIVKALNERRADGRTSRTIQVDPILAAAVCAVLECQVTH
ncbi:MAG: cytidylate kinase-like family protein [Anaerolineales bacterium]|nr:cytidylate kinase-like family protein [Anaerolineales bacterium]